MQLLRTALVVVALLLTTTTLVGQNEFKSWPLGQAPQELRPAISRADQVVVAMQDTFVRELTDALDRGGATGAINSCHLDATAIAQRVGREEGIDAGRTSDRLRSPTNAPRPWAADLVKAYAGRPARNVDGFAVDLGDKVGVLRPIAMRPMCVGCHGPGDGLPAGVKTVLKDQYPSDRATGFGVGEIRGWFWVEVPKQRR
jgi:hypothetical protein